MRHSLLVLLFCLPALALGQSAVTVRGPAGAAGASAAIFVSAYLGANTAYSAGSNTMIFDTEAADAASVYDNTTGVMTVATTGLYLVSSCIHDWNGAGEQIQVSVLVEEAVLHRGMLATDAEDDSVCVTAMVSVSATDTIAIQLHNFSSGMTVRGGQDRTWLTIAGPL